MWRSCYVTVRIQSAEEPPWKPKSSAGVMQFQHVLILTQRWRPDVGQQPAPNLPGDDNPFSQALAAQGLRVGRNDLCPCGSGKKLPNSAGKTGLSVAKLTLL